MRSEVSQSETDRAAYTLAKDFLLRSGVSGVTPDLVEKYLHLSTTIPRPHTIAGVYKRMLESAQNANMKAGVIGGAIGGVNNLEQVLCGFEPTQVLDKYASGWEGILNDIIVQLKPRGSIRKTSRSLGCAHKLL